MKYSRTVPNILKLGNNLIILWWHLRWPNAIKWLTLWLVIWGPFNLLYRQHLWTSSTLSWDYLSWSFSDYSCVAFVTRFAQLNLILLLFSGAFIMIILPWLSLVWNALSLRQHRVGGPSPTGAPVPWTSWTAYCYATADSVPRSLDLRPRRTTAANLIQHFASC